MEAFEGVLSQNAATNEKIRRPQQPFSQGGAWGSQKRKSNNDDKHGHARPGEKETHNIKLREKLYAQVPNDILPQ